MPKKDEHCQPRKIKRSIKLSGAKLTEIGKVKNLQSCIEHCCRKDSCDVVYMEDETCYTVECQDGLQCRSFEKPAEKDENTLIAYMQRTVKKEQGKQYVD